MSPSFQASIDQLWSRFQPLTPIERYRLVIDSFGFRPETSWQSKLSAGMVRADLAAVWESGTQAPVPVKAFRDLFDEPTDRRLRTLLWDLAESQSQGEFSTSTSALVLFLQQQTNAGAQQQTLFGAAAANTADAPCRPNNRGESVSSLHELIAAGRTFPTIYADPPWAYDNEASRGAAVNHYPVMSLDEIRREPVAQLAAKNAHLHLWTTNSFLPAAIDLIGVWGFEFKSCLVWVKPDLGCGNYWRVSHEVLLLGVRGSLPFRDRSQRSWIHVPRMEHSRKPGRVRLLIEQVSPGPYLELYGRAEIPDSGWTVYGNRVERRLF